MIPSVSARRYLLQITALAFVAGSALAQAPPKYDRATETTPQNHGRGVATGTSIRPEADRLSGDQNGV